MRCNFIGVAVAELPPLSQNNKTLNYVNPLMAYFPISTIIRNKEGEGGGGERDNLL